MNKRTRIISAGLSAVTLCGAKFVWDIRHGTKKNLKYINKNIRPLRRTKSKCELEADGSYSLIKDKYDTFKILQITDLHIGGGFLSVNEDRFATARETHRSNCSRYNLFLPISSALA